MKKVNIGGRKVGEGEEPYIILEAGSNWLDLNHKGDEEYNFNNARKMIAEAHKLGADAIKFQTFKADAIVSTKGPTPKYLTKITSKSLYNIFKEIAMPREWLPELAGYAHKKRIHFLSTPFDHEAVDMLVEECKVPAIKVASFEITDLPFLEYIAKKGIPVIVSTGMADAQDIIDARNTIVNAGNEELIFMHCVIAYPPALADLNLRKMETLRQITQVPVGWSDHSMEVWIPAVAVALGAVAIEKHFTLSRAQKGPDHGFALNPHEAGEMIKMVRGAYNALGTSILGHVAAEEEMYRMARRCLQAGPRGIRKGETFKKEHFVIKRGNGILPRELDKVLGKKAKRDFEPDEILRWGDI